MTPGSSARAYFSVSGMHCAACATTANRVLEQQPGVIAADISFASELGRLRYDPAMTDPASILKSLNQLGYAARLIGGERDDARGRFRGNTLLQLITALAFGMQVMGLSLAHLYPAYAAGRFDAPDVRSVHYLAWFLSTPVLFYGGLSFLTGAARALQARTATMDTLSAYFYSVWFTLSGGGAVYFDSVAMITVFVMTGRYLETLGGDRARKEVRSLLRLQPDRALIREGGQWREKPAADLAPGNSVLVKPGQRVPADLRIIEGSSALDEALLTGESVPVSKAPGDMAFAGTMVIDGALVCEVVRTGADARLAQITGMVERALAAKPPIQRLADTVSAWFAVAVIVAAVLTMAVWLGLGRPLSDGFLAAVAVLVVACPCALGLATPLAISIATGRAGLNGILMRTPAALETGATVHRIVFDKTGTLTTGQMGVTVEPAAGFTGAYVLGLAATVEQYSQHPLAQAIVAANRSDGLPPAHHIQNAPGRGISGMIACNGQRYRVSVGSLGYLGAAANDVLIERARSREDDGQTVVWIAIDHEVAGFVALRDAPNPSVRDMLTALDSMDINAALRSGDSARTVRAIAADIGLPDAKGDCTPEDKARRIGGWQASGEKIAMVGDGINDAPALAQADLSIAMGSGADVAGETSDLILTRSDLALIPWFLGLCRKTRRIIRENLIWAFAYNIVMVPLAATGSVTPMIAAAAMAASSLLVVANSLRLHH